MKALITGPRGFVGARVMEAFGAEAVAAPSLRTMEEEDIRRLVGQTEPDVIVHTAAMSDIGACARDPEGSYRANVLLPVWLAATGVKLVAFSTDQVYSGCTGPGPYREEETEPANLYAKHKLEMEQRTLDSHPETVLLRATWMYDMPMYGVENRGNFLVNMLWKREMAVSFAQRRAVTYVREVAELTRQAAGLPGGVYNFGSENDLPFGEVARWLAETLQLRVTLRDAGPQHALWMKCDKLRGQGIRFRSTVDGLKQCIADYHLRD